MRKGLLIVGWGATLAAAFFFGGVSKQAAVMPDQAALQKERDDLEARVEASESRARKAEHDLSMRKSSDVAADMMPAKETPVVVSGTPARMVPVDATSVIKLKGAAQRARAFADLLAGMNAQNAQQIMATFLAKGFETTREEEEIRTLAQAWAAIDGKGALDYLKSIDREQRPENTMRGALAEWARNDLDGAEKWARSATTNQPNYYMIGVIAGAAEVDLSRAESLLYEMPYGRARGDAMAYVAAVHLANGNADAMDWAIHVPDPRLAMASIRKVAAQVALTDPAMAANWVVKNSNDEQMRYNVAEIVRQWSDISEVDAANWAIALPPGPAKESALLNTLPALAKTQPAMAEQLLLKYPQSRETDQARIQIAKNYFEADPIRALAWANTVSDADVRNFTTRRILDSWSKRDPAGAAAFLQPKVQ